LRRRCGSDRARGRGARRPRGPARGLARPRRRDRQRERGDRRRTDRLHGGRRRLRAGAPRARAASRGGRRAGGLPARRRRRGAAVRGRLVRRRHLGLRRHVRGRPRPRRVGDPPRLPPRRHDRARELDAGRIRRRAAPDGLRARAAAGRRAVPASVGNGAAPPGALRRRRLRAHGHRADVHVPLPLGRALRLVLPALVRPDREGVRVARRAGARGARVRPDRPRPPARPAGHGRSRRTGRLQRSNRNPALAGSHTKGRRHMRLRTTRVLTLTALGLALFGTVVAHAASPAVTARVQNGTLTVTGTNAADKNALIFNGATIDIDVGEDGTTDFSFDRTTVASIEVNGGGGDDDLDASRLRFAGSVTLNGGNGADTLESGREADVMLGGAGNDTFRWDPGDGSDVVEGQGGHDLLDFHGSNAAEKMAFTANGTRVLFTRDVAAITLDLNAIETADVATLGSADTVTVGDLSGTGMKTVNVDLGAPDGAADT